MGWNLIEHKNAHTCTVKFIAFKDKSISRGAEVITVDHVK